jgi:hypothetical protein
VSYENQIWNEASLFLLKFQSYAHQLKRNKTIKLLMLKDYHSFLGTIYKGTKIIK